jgi:hypothetical protein
MGGGGSKTEGISGTYYHSKIISKSPTVRQTATFTLVCQKHDKKDGGDDYAESGMNQKTGTFIYSYVYEQVGRLPFLKLVSVPRSAKAPKRSTAAAGRGSATCSSRAARLFSFGIQRRPRPRGTLWARHTFG